MMNIKTALTTIKQEVRFKSPDYTLLNTAVNTIKNRNKELYPPEINIQMDKLIQSLTEDAHTQSISLIQSWNAKTLLDQMGY